jgi:cytoskeletal protein RodZ
VTNVTSSEEIAEKPTTVGGRLRAAREEQGLSLDDIGRQTRVPVRHLVQIEEGRLQGLPAAPYSAGFVKAYARAVGLDPVALSHDFRADFDHANRATPRIAYEPYEPADPVRLPPRLLAIVAVLIALLLVAGYAIWRSGLLTGESAETRAKLAAGGEENTATAAAGSPTPAAPIAAPVPVGGAVRLTAIQPVWFEVTDRATGERLFTRVLDEGKYFDVPATAADPVVKTGRPEAIAVTVGGVAVAPLGEPAHTVANVSLKGASLLARPAPAAPVAAADSLSEHRRSAEYPSASSPAPAAADPSGTPAAFRDAAPIPSPAPPAPATTP